MKPTLSVNAIGYDLAPFPSSRITLYGGFGEEINIPPSHKLALQQNSI